MTLTTTQITNTVTVTEDPDVITIVADNFTQSGGGGGGGSGTVTSASVTTANGVSATVANATTTPAFTFTLGAITPSTVRGLTITTTTGTLTITNAKTFSVSNTLTLAGTDGSTLNIGTGGTLGTLAYQNGTFTGAGIEALLDARYSDAGWRCPFYSSEGTPSVAGTDKLNSYYFDYEGAKLYVRGAASWDLLYDFTALASVETTWRVGTTAPDNNVGIDGDWYNNTDTGVVYHREGGIYVGRGGLLGATAAQGSLADGAAQKSANLSDLASVSTARINLGLGSLATQSGTFSGTSSGTNTGDQTSIVGITGTFAQFNTAVTDADLARTSGPNTFTGVQTASTYVATDTVEAGTSASAGNITIWNGDGAANYVSISCGGFITDARSWDFPDANGTFLGQDTAQIVTGKTISGASNTLTNIAPTSQTTAGKTFTLGFTADGGGSAIGTGKIKGFVTCPVGATIVGWTMTSDATSSWPVVKVWKIATGTARPTSANSINTSGVAIASGTHVRSTTLTDFTSTTVTANDVFAFNIESNGGSATEITFALELTKS